MSLKIGLIVSLAVVMVIVAVIHVVPHRHCLRISLKHKKIYYLMDMLNKVCDKYNLHYWAEGGTLLGAVREQQIISHDDDADVSMTMEHATKLYEMKDIIEKEFDIEISAFGHGLCGFLNGCYEDLGMYKIFIPGDYTTWVDVFVREKVGNRYEYIKRSKSIWSDSWYHATEVEEPFKMYKFGEIKIRGPANPTEYLTRKYGNWQVPVHSKGHSINPMVYLHGTVCAKSLWFYCFYGVVIVCLVVSILCCKK